MLTLLYEYAENEQGELTHISTAHKGICYRCIECGAPLIIKEGTKKRKHFAHKSNSNCDGESYIHKIWKRRIKDKFYNSNSFLIRYTVATPCNDITKCSIKRMLPNLKCNIPYIKEFDLKQEYDTCEEEFKYNGFVGDLVLYDSKNPDKEPLFIEIDYTHPCDEEKIASKIKIIEIKVKDDTEKSINLFETGQLNLKFGVNIGNPYDMKHLPHVRFYNFNRLPYPTIDLYSFKHNANGQCEMHYSKGYTCKSIPDNNDDAAWGVAISEDIINSRESEYYLEAIMALAAKNNFTVRDCRLCFNKIKQEIFHRKCPAMTDKGYASAQQCPNYRILKPDVKRMSDRLIGIPHSISIPKQQ